MAAVTLNYSPDTLIDNHSSSLKTRVARLFTAMVEARQKAAEREVARLIDLNGGRLTDDLERRIGNHFV